MEYNEALGLLKDRLDVCLVQHAKDIDRNDVGDIYLLQDYSETHYYMKAAHDYTPAEVEALLSFVDPLEVAFWCREENTHKVGLPICEVLKEIGADSRFKKIPPELSLEDKTALLIRKLEINLNNTFDFLNQLDNGEIGKRSENIAASFAAYSYVRDELMGDNLDESVIDHLLSLDRPIQYLTEHWPECSLFGPDVIADIKDEITKQNAQHEQSESVHERLKNASRTVREQTQLSKPQRSDGAR